MRTNDKPARKIENRTSKTFEAVLIRLIEATTGLIDSEGITNKEEYTEWQRLSLLKLAAASRMPFPEFCEALSCCSQDAAKQFSDQLDTLSALYEVCENN